MKDDTHFGIAMGSNSDFYINGRYFSLAARMDISCFWWQTVSRNAINGMIQTCHPRTGGMQPYGYVEISLIIELKFIILTKKLALTSLHLIETMVGKNMPTTTGAP